MLQKADFFAASESSKDCTLVSRCTCLTRTGVRRASNWGHSVWSCSKQSWVLWKGIEKSYQIAFDTTTTVTTLQKLDDDADGFD